MIPSLKNRIRSALAALSLMLVAFDASAAAAGVPAGVMPQAGKPAPALVVQDMDGKTLDLKTLRGRWVMVHFWASWCGPCRKELPSLQAMGQSIDAASLPLVMVNTAEPEEQVFAFLPTVAPELHTYLDPDGSATERWQPRGLPSTFLIDPNGHIRYLALGGRAWDTPPFIAFLKRLARETAAAPASGKN